MRRRDFITLLAGAAVAACGARDSAVLMARRPWND
jgi:hypothetical protein